MSSKNRESLNNESSPTAESQWDDLAKMGEENFFEHQSSKVEAPRETPDDRETRIKLAAAKVRTVFAKTADNKAARRIDRLTNGNHKGIGHDVTKDRMKVIDLVESGRVDLTNPSIAENYIQAKLATTEIVVGEDGHERTKTSSEKIEDMVRTGLPPEKPVMAFTEKIVREISEINTSAPQHAQDKLEILDGEHLSAMADVLEKYDLPEAREFFVKNIDIQNLGQEVTQEVLLRRVNDEKDREAYQKKLEEWRKSFGLIKNMGYIPQDENVSNLILGNEFYSNEQIKRLKLAEELSLMSTDKLQQLKRSRAEILFEDFDRVTLASRHPELCAALPLSKQKYLETLRKTGSDAGINHLSDEDIEKYFDEDGAKPKLWQRVFSGGGFGGIIKYAESVGQSKNSFDEPSERKRSQDDIDFSLLGLDEKQTEVLNTYRGIDGSANKELFARLIRKNFAEIPMSRIKVVPQVLSRFQESNAEELRVGAYNLAPQLLGADLDNDDRMFEKIEQIEDIYLHNNLPYVGKVYKTFRILHPVGKHHWATEAMERGALAGLPETGIRSKDTLLFNDLLKASMGSNNRDLRKYLEGLQEGDRLAKQVMAGRDDFSDSELEILRGYSTHLATIYGETQAGRETPATISGDVLADIKTFSSLMSPTERYSVPDRVVRSFGFGLGIKSCGQMLEKMDQITAEADYRNRIAAIKGEFLLESGDLIKSTETEYLGGILQNGSVCKDFLNGSATPDQTPLDTDVNILSEGLSGNIAEGVDRKNAVAMFLPTHCMIVLKGDRNSGRNRFTMEEDHAPYSPNKYEVWNNDGDNHGIRVGFPSTEIDYLIYDDLGKGNHGDLVKMKFEVVRNGFYIPIVDKATGGLTFSPEEYDTMRENMAGLSYYGADEYRFADQPQGEESPLVPSLELGEFTIGDDVIPSTIDLISQSENNHTEVDEKRRAILDQAIMPVLEKFSLSYKPQLDGDLTEGIVECIDTGSTGRYSNTPGDGDFDFMMKLDYGDVADKAKMEEIRESLCAQMRANPDATIEIVSGNIRAKGVQLEGLAKPVDIDITFGQKTNKVQYSTDMALRDYYSSMSEDKRKEVVANVVFAKELLKAAKVYKGRNSRPAQGGLGGVGVENWVLQNGGSFLLAARRFMEVAEQCSSFEEFCDRYTIWDFGENHKNSENGVPEHDNFVRDNMSSDGYNRMKKTLSQFLSRQS